MVEEEGIFPLELSLCYGIAWSTSVVGEAVPGHRVITLEAGREYAEGRA